MSAAVMIEPIAVASTRFNARNAGVLWLVTMVTGTFAVLVYAMLVVPGNPSETAINISAHEALFRTGIAAALIAIACYIGATLVVYAILKPLDRNVATLAALFSFMAAAGAAISFGFGLVPLVVLESAQYLTLFTVEQLQTLTLTSLRFSAPAGNISFVFFGLHCFLVASLSSRINRCA
jgi:hypothetical protein